MYTFVTHSGAFHEDEIFALALLRKFLFKDESHLVIRTRDNEMIADHVGRTNTFIVDVGSVFDPSIRCFDHHQAECNEAWPDGVPKSSCGMVWDYLVAQGFVDLPEEVVDRIQSELIIPIDKEDNAVQAFPEVYFVSAYNRDGNPDAQYDQFIRASDAAFDYLDNVIYRMVKNYNDEKAISDFIDEHGETEVVVFNKRFADTEIHLASYKNPKIFCFPRDDNGCWGIQVVPQRPDIPFSQRISAPEEWRGLVDGELQDVSGFEKLTFCHKSGFFMVARNASMQEAKEVAEAVLYSYRED